MVEYIFQPQTAVLPKVFFLPEYTCLHSFLYVVIMSFLYIIFIVYGAFLICLQGALKGALT